MNIALKNWPRPYTKAVQGYLDMLKEMAEQIYGPCMACHNDMSIMILTGFNVFYNFKNDGTVEVRCPCCETLQQRHPEIKLLEAI